MSIFKRLAAAAAILVSAAAASTGLFAASASAAPVQFTVTVQADHRLLTSAHLTAGEVLHVGLNGQAVTIVNEQFNGGGTVAWTAQAFPKYLIHKTFIMTVGGTA